MKYDTMKQFQSLFDEAAENGNLGKYKVIKSADAGEDYLPAKGENSWVGLQRDYHYGIYNFYNDDVDYSIQLTDWRYQDDYYVMIFDNALQSTASVELKNEKGNILVWRYKPCKQDGRNTERKRIFVTEFADCVIDFVIPKSLDELEEFCEKLIQVAEIRKQADYLGDK